MAQWQKISNMDDFPNLAVYHKGGVFSVVFKNLEFDKSRQDWLLLLFVVVGIASVSVGHEAADGAKNVFLVAFVGFIGTLLFGGDTSTIRRTIVLDYPKNELRVLRYGRVKGRYSLRSLHSFSVGPHPHTEWARINRQERGKKDPSKEEKTHCLFGHFGMGGGETLALISRAEWPCWNSLREVQEAVQWARALGDERKQQAEAGQAYAPQPQAPNGVNPPLD